MKKVKTIEELKEMVEDYMTFSCKPSSHKLPTNYITDEEKSVKWNREEVIRNNEAYEEEVKQLNREKCRLYEEFKIELERTIKKTYPQIVNPVPIIKYVRNLWDSYVLVEQLFILLDTIEDCLK